jgi:flagellar motor switch protein FliN/FliY
MSQMIESFMHASARMLVQPLELDEPAAGPASAQAALQGEAHPLHAVKVRLQVCVGAAEMSVGELLAARAGQVLVLQQAVEQAVDLLLEGKVVARGQLVAVDGAFALRITEVPLPLKL